MDRHIALFLLTAAIAFAIGLVLPESTPPAGPQPIAFNHLIHTKKTTCWECHFVCEENRDEDGDVDCDDCDEEDGPFCKEHLTCPDHKLPGLPGADICLRCHEDDLLDLSESEAGEGDPEHEAKRVLLDYIGFDEYEDPIIHKPIEWVRVTRLPLSNVYFSHRTHALVAELACEECHGDIGIMEEPPTYPPVEMGMNWCLDCHEDKAATEDCASCHR